LRDDSTDNDYHLIGERRESEADAISDILAILGGTPLTYELTDDLTFQAGKTYYLQQGDSAPYTYVPATVVVGLDVPANTYYQLAE
jgi:hypothetical protein